MQSVAIRMSMSPGLFGITKSRSFDTGEKHVRMVFISTGNLGIVVRPSMVPVMRAVFTPNCRNAYPLMFSYRYSAVSENAVNIIIFLFPGLIGFCCFSAMMRCSSHSLKSCSGVMSDTIMMRSSSTSKSASSSRLHEMKSMSRRSMRNFLPMLKMSIF